VYTPDIISRYMSLLTKDLMQLRNLFGTVCTCQVTQVRLKFISILTNREQATDSIYKRT